MEQTTTQSPRLNSLIRWLVPLAAVITFAVWFYYAPPGLLGKADAVGYAICETVTGPCVKPQRAPIFKFTKQAMGPGGEEFFHDAEGNLWMAYHAWTAPLVGYPEGERSLRIEPVTFVDGVPTIAGPTVDPQPRP